MTILDLVPLTPESVPEAGSDAFARFLDGYFELGQRLAESMNSWLKHSTKINGTVQMVNLTSASSMTQIRKDLGIKEYWCGRVSHHTEQSVNALLEQPSGPLDKAKQLIRRASEHQVKAESTEVDRQAAMMKQTPRGLYERFRRGLLEYHSENERQYIESCRETSCLQVFQPHVAEVWRLTYVTPPPTSPRTFVVLLLSRELNSTPGQRSFMNISIPFAHPDCPEKQGAEKSRVRGKYVSVERVCEVQGGGVEWRMATSSDAGGNIPRFITNQSLPGSISEDVPSFLKWAMNRWPEESDAAGDRSDAVVDT